MSLLSYLKPKKSVVSIPAKKITKAIISGLRTEDVPPDTRDLGKPTVEVADTFTDDGYGKEGLGSLSKSSFPEQFNFPGRGARR